VAIVPTMGALHAGHLALVREAFGRATFVVVSIFVNPTQFGPNEDFARYPRRLEDDVRSLQDVGDPYVFVPAVRELYPAGEQTRVRVGAVAEPLCGRFRPGHFEGVATVVAKLFALVGACEAVFGRKDYQQLLVVRRMTEDLLLPVKVVGHATVRESDGLAMSSRNAYLSNEERERALGFVRGLDAATRSFDEGERRARRLEAIARGALDAVGAAIEYVEIRNADTLEEIETVGDRAVLAVAGRIGTTRLIDNVVLGEERPPLGSN
jgi:pantoate--beta-alanine ligase